MDPQLSIGGEQLASMGLVLDKPASVPSPPVLQDVSWVLADLTTGDVIAAKAPHARMLPASTLKALTALTLIPRLGASKQYLATQEDANADGTRVGLLPGQPYTGADLFRGLLMSSGNDAAYALARAAGGQQATLAAMNEQARLLGAHDTVAKDPSGLDAPGQTSSAYDLALIGRAALGLKDFRAYVTTKQTPFPGKVDPKTGKRVTYLIQNHNKLLYNYPGTIGIKNGYTNAAKRTFISAVTRGGKTYLLSEMYGLGSSWRPQAAIFDWAFAYGHQVTPVGTLVEPGTVTEPLTPPRAETSTDPSPGAVRDGGDAQDTASESPTASVETSAGPDSAAAAAREPVAALAPWVGVGGLGAAVLLIVVLASRAIARSTRRH